MITTAEEYQKYLWQLQDQNQPVSAILLPSDENVYEIDLDTRTISAPEFLSIKNDHAAETIYFLIDRYYDNMDLSTSACVVQYKNMATGKERFFPVPFYDITTFSNAVSDEFIRIFVKENEYKINTYYIQDEQYNFILTSEEYNPTQNYYIKNSPNLNNKYIKVNLTTNKYTPNSFYYLDTNPESLTYGQYCQSLATEFDPKINYFAKVDRRFIPVSTNASDYQVNKYYFINSQGKMEKSLAKYDKTENYYMFIDSQKILFPWIISKEVTEQAGMVEFSIKFYQIQPQQKQQIGSNEQGVPIYEYTYPYIYSLNTKVAKSIVLDGMNNIVENVSNQEQNDFNASILEGLYSEIARLSGDYNLYWFEATDIKE